MMGQQEQKQPPIRFAWALFGLGIVLILVFAGHLGARGLRHFPTDPTWQVPGGEPARGRQAILQYGCTGCHVIPGVRRAQGRVGPRLEDLNRQIYLAGILPNTPDNLIRWIRNPQGLNPQTAMPNLGITDQDARDIAAYIYSVR